MTDEYPMLMREARSYVELTGSGPIAKQDIAVAICQHIMARHHPQGSKVPGKDHEVTTREMVKQAVALFDEVFSRDNETERVWLKITRQKNQTPQVRGLLVYHNGKTVLIPAETSAGIAEIGGHAIFLAHPNGGSELILAIMLATEQAKKTTARTNGCSGCGTKNHELGTVRCGPET